MKDWKKLLIDKRAPLKEALALFEKNVAQIAIASKDGKLLGTVTDGDIRRALLNSLGLDTPIEKIMNTSPITVCASHTEEEIKVKMFGADIRYVPIIDKDKLLLGIYSNKDFQEDQRIPNDIIIMAGGEGKRLRPLTENRPKPMVDLNGRPILEKLLLRLISQGFYNFHISINYLGGIIEDYFGDGSKWGVNISYLKEDKKLGTAGALKLLRDIKDDFIVLNGDLVTTINMKNMLQHHKKESSQATVAVRNAAFQVPYGVILSNDNHVTSIQEKPTLNYNINCGLYVLSPSILPLVQKTSEAIDMPHLLNTILDQNEKVSVFSIFEDWYDVADLSDLETLKRQGH